MSLRKFNPHANMRIDKVKAHHYYLKPQKKKYTNYEIDEEAELHRDKVPWEIKHIKNLAAGKKKQTYKKESLFDTNNDGKPIKVKKESRKDKLSRAFIMMDGKKYHSIGSKPFL